MKADKKAKDGNRSGDLKRTDEEMQGKRATGKQ
jgi:hypothetical protein